MFPPRWRCTSGRGCPGHPQHLWHRHRAAEQPAADVFPPCQPPLPQRALSCAHPGRGRGQELICPECGARFYAPSAEELAFNSQGALPHLRPAPGTVQTVDRATLVPDESLTIDEGAVAPWNSLMWSLMTDVCRAMGVRTDVPFRDLTDVEKEIVYDGPAEKKHIFYHSKNSEQAGELDFTYYSAVRTVENALSKVKDEKGMKRVEKFLRQDICPDCGGSRLCAAARAPRLQGIPLDEAACMTLSDLVAG